ncbi:type VI secretion system Vgr family protein, partial [Enterobacter wuhouensis]|uniref:type VI secretion system Vgr family protein n=1 Tax=Enterobacter wuhouensis TaxID=2529381 RepID=UPI001F6177ED
RNVLRTPANNKLRMEDRRGEEHIKLATEYGKTQLNGGHLVDSQGQRRGQGTELRTDERGTIRAGKGLFVSADAQVKARGEALDRDAALKEIDRLNQQLQQLEMAAEQAQAKKSLTEGGKKYWGNQFSFKISDPKCGTQILPIEFKVLFVKSDEHYIFKIHDKYDREGVTGNVLDVSKNTGPWTYAHEFGHCYGLPDEYGYTPDAEENDQVVYYKPDGSLDSPISVPYNGGDPSDPASTIMAAYGNTIILKRQGWIIAIEANEIFHEPGLGRRIRCDIV